MRAEMIDNFEPNTNVFDHDFELMGTMVQFAENNSAGNRVIIMHRSMNRNWIIVCDERTGQRMRITFDVS